MNTSTVIPVVATPNHQPLFAVYLSDPKKSWSLDAWHVCLVVGWDAQGQIVVSDLEDSGKLRPGAWQGGPRARLVHTYERACSLCDDLHTEANANRRFH